MRFFLIAIKALALVVATMAVLITAYLWSHRIPSDSRIQEQFVRDNILISELLDKLSQEPPNIVGITKEDVMVDDTTNWVLPEKAGFSKAHFAEYRALMDKAHVTQLWRYEGQTNFNVAASGFVSFGWRLAFTYARTPPAPLIQSIDYLPARTSEDRGPVYRPLGGDWYIRLIY
jgi:hypothetical protein